MVVNVMFISNVRNWWNIDALGYIRGKYSNPLFALRVGYNAVRNGFRDQLVATKQEGIENIGIKISNHTDTRRDTMFVE